MLKNLLFPNRFKRIGWMLFVPSLFLGLFLTLTGYEPQFLNGHALSLLPSMANEHFFGIVEVNFAQTIVGASFIVGALLVGFSREKNEDEFIARIRLSSLLWAVLVHYILLLLAFLLVYDTAFLSIMVYNMFTVLIIFIARFHFILYRNIKSLASAE